MKSVQVTEFYSVYAFIHWYFGKQQCFEYRRARLIKCCNFWHNFNFADFNLYRGSFLCLVTVLRPAEEFFTYTGTILPLKGCKIWPMLSAQGFEQGGIFIVPHLLWNGTSVFPVSSEGPSHSVASYDTQGGMEDLF
jgi:hypothetical protein